METYPEDVEGLDEERVHLVPQPLVPRAVSVHVLSAGRDVKVACKVNDNTEYRIFIVYDNIDIGANKEGSLDFHPSSNTWHWLSDCLSVGVFSLI